MTVVTCRGGRIPGLQFALLALSVYTTPIAMQRASYAPFCYSLHIYIYVSRTSLYRSRMTLCCLHVFSSCSPHITASLWCCSVGLQPCVTHCRHRPLRVPLHWRRCWSPRTCWFPRALPQLLPHWCRAPSSSCAWCRAVRFSTLPFVSFFNDATLLYVAVPVGDAAALFIVDRGPPAASAVSLAPRTFMMPSSWFRPPFSHTYIERSTVCAPLSPPLAHSRAVAYRNAGFNCGLAFYSFSVLHISSLLLSQCGATVAT